MFHDLNNFKPSEIDPHTKRTHTSFSAKGASVPYGAGVEEKILKFWQKNKIFEKSVAKPKTYNLKPKTFVFYDGPPFATGLPHYGHILASVIKDVIPRYRTMKGCRVPRRWGWDCHGLPIENEIEKELNLKTKKDIENIGIKTFNETAKKRVLFYASDWKKIISRIGRWVDMENDYKTMDWQYTESVWWIFKKLYGLGLIYEAYRVVPYCPRCGTPLSNFELNQPDAYKDVEDQSIYVKFKVTPGQKIGKQKMFNDVYFLAWTTTPWTLPGNAALAVGEKINYVKVRIGREKFILAKERLGILNEKYELEDEFLGGKLIGLQYDPLYKINDQWSRANGYKVVAADFVSMKDGTGIVHIAPAFGEEDMKVGRQNNLPSIITVDLEGKVMSGMGIPGENLFVKKADEDIKKDLKKKGLLLKEEKIIHSYPHCWRCETPLIYYPTISWYIAVAKIKKQLIKNNQEIHWTPEHIRDGRFGKWLEEARDWDVSRSRYWGAPIPVWKCEKCGKIKAIGSLGELKENSPKSGNQYFAMRHGEAESNLFNIISSNYKNGHHLTEKGKKQVLASAGKLKEIDIIFSSDFVRCRETAEIVAEAIGYPKNKIIFDERLREINTGVFDGKKPEDYHKYFFSNEEKFYKTPPEGENLTTLKNRTAGFLYEIEKKYSRKNILIISHEYSIWLMFAGALGLDSKKAVAMKEGIRRRANRMQDFIKTGEAKKLDFVPLPHNNNFELDFHRPYIDEAEFLCRCGGIMKRIDDVFDCWFESGAMPYAQAHYPFENKKEFGKNFPAEFIAEGIDQTRGWFYTLLVLSTVLFNKPAYKNVIVNGIILSETGQKMSKHLKNYPDPMEIINKYGADALRLYLLSSSAVNGENLNFSEKGVDEIYKKVILRLWNVYRFYELYADQNGKSQRKSVSILEKWILARLEELKLEVSKWLDKYELDKATRPITDFIDDLSTWYIRRSRERFKTGGKDKQSVVSTTKFVLGEFSKVIAPFMPFMAEGIYQSIQKSKFKINESVHLTDWPEVDRQSIDKKLLESMAEVRKIASLALEARQKAQIKVRQPLSELRIKSYGLRDKTELLDILKDEINVKEIVFDSKIRDEVELNVEITPLLREEGMVREFARMIQDLRKKTDCQPKDKIYLWLESTDDFKAILSKHLKDFQKNIGAKTIKFYRAQKCDAESEVQIENQKIRFGLKKPR